MFNGIIQTTGNVLATTQQAGCVQLQISPSAPFEDLSLGGSIAVNGVCLTVTSHTGDYFFVTVVPETLAVTNLATLTPTSMVNLERSLKLTERISGHIVQGHVDGTGKIISIQPDQGEALLVKVKCPHTLMKYIVNKGYVALDGMSITVIHTGEDWFTVTFIPHTQAVTIIPHYQTGDYINIEVDMMSKYIEKLLGASHVLP